MKKIQALLFYFVAIFIFIVPVPAHALQMNAWFFADEIVEFHVTPPATVKKLSYPTQWGAAQYVANGLMGNNGAPIFYIADDRVYDALGNEMGWSGLTTSESVILPFPDNDCEQQKYYIFGLQTYGFAVGKLNYSVVDMNLNNGLGDVVSGLENVTLYTGNETGALAASHPKNGEYYLYFISEPFIYKYTVDSLGISAPSLLYQGSAVDYGSNEAELSHDGKKLAWADYFGGTVYIMDLDADGNFVGIKEYNNVFSCDVQIKGMEFSVDGKDIYLAGHNSGNSTCRGIIKLNLATSQTTMVPNSADYSESKLELAKDKLIYAVSSTGMMGVDPATVAFNTNSFVALTNPPSNNYYDAYHLPDQIDGYDYSELPGLDLFDSQTYEVTGNQTWSNSSNPFQTGSNNANVIRIEKELRVKNGASLNLSAMDFEFGENAQVIVEDNAKLTLAGTTFSGLGSCEKMWEGIDVWGSDYGTPGKLVLQKVKETPQIRHAEVAVMLSKGIFTQAIDGGIIEAQYASFIDNLNGILFIGSDNSNPSIVKNNYFYTSTKGLRSPYLGETGKMLLANYMTDLDYPVENNRFYNADYGVWNSTGNLSLVNNKFSYLDYGIYSNNYVGASFTTAHEFSQNTFRDVHTGIYIKKGYQDLIQENKFNADQNSPQDNFYGVYLDETIDFEISGNQFAANQYSVYIKNAVSGDVGTEASGNSFTNSWRSLQTDGDNSQVSVKCNTFDNQGLSKNDFSVFWYNNGTMADQGDTYDAAGNVFYNAHTSGTYNIKYDIAVPNGNAGFDYYYSAVGADELPVTYPFIQTWGVEDLSPCN